MILQLSTLDKVGRFANNCQLYCAARKLAELQGATLQTNEWIGQRVFDLHDEPYKEYNHDAIQLVAREDGLYPVAVTDEEYRKYLSPKMEFQIAPSEIAVHVRRGDFCMDGAWPYVAMSVMEQGVRDAGLDWNHADIFTEETPHKISEAAAELQFFVDFWMMTKAQNLFCYPRSSFSALAGRLNPNNVYLPMRGSWHGGGTDCKWELRK